MSTPNIGEGRPLRFCPACKQVDDHPRHTVLDGLGADVALHMDCCREQGCPDGTCDVVTAGAEKARGAKLLKHIAESDGDDVQKRLEELREARPELRSFTLADGAEPVRMEMVQR